MGAGHAHALYVHEHSPIHRLAPEVKVAAAFVFVLGVALTPREVLAAFAVDAAALAATARIARIPARFVLARMLVVLPFVAFAFLIPFVAGGEDLRIVGVTVSREGLWGAWNILAKALLGVTTSILLAATTPVTDILRGLERLRVPRAFTSIAMFMMRYLEVVAAQLRQTRTAIAARGGEPTWFGQVRPLASAAGALFVRSYERGERIHEAMLARGYTDSMPALESRPATRREWLIASVLPLASTVAAVVAWALR